MQPCYLHPVSAGLTSGVFVFHHIFAAAAYYVKGAAIEKRKDRVYDVQRSSYVSVFPK